MNIRIVVEKAKCVLSHFFFTKLDNWTCHNGCNLLYDADNKHGCVLDSVSFFFYPLAARIFIPRSLSPHFTPTRKIHPVRSFGYLNCLPIFNADEHMYLNHSRGMRTACIASEHDIVLLLEHR